VVLTSHTYENGKNEQSHQDPLLCEALMGEPAHISRVLFPCDHNTAAAVMEALYQTRGQIWTLVVAKRDLPVLLDGETARRLVREGAVALRESARPDIVLTAIGAYQIGETLTASRRLAERGVEHSVVYMIEPRRFAEPKDEEEAPAYASAELRSRLYPESVKPRLFVTHTRAGRIQGLLQVIDSGPKTLALGYRNVGGTYDVKGMLFVNDQSWAHIVATAARLMDLPPDRLLEARERDALEGRASPQGVLF
jgi:phosphoketolase